MKSTTWNPTMVRAAIAAGGMLVSTMAFTEQKTAPITVQAQREAVITHDRVGSSMKQMGELVTLTRRVTTADLDLTRQDGLDELHKRISTVAQETCRELEMLYPKGATDVPGYEHTNENCVQNAIDGAKVDVDAAIALAKK